MEDIHTPEQPSTPTDLRPQRVSISKAHEEVHIQERRSDPPLGYLDSTSTNEKQGYALVEQKHLIPSTGERKSTTKYEYWTFCLFYFSINGAPIITNAGSLRQMLLNLAYPDDWVQWGGETLSINSLLLDLTGILFAVQLVTLLILGPYADYGTWRPYIMMVSQVILYICQFAMCAFSKPSQWQGAQALYVLGNLAFNIAKAFFQATFPGLVRDLPRMIESEHEVITGTRSAEEHAALDSYERSKLFNLVNIVGSVLVVIFYAISLGVTAGVGYSTNEQLITSYRVLMGYLGAVTVLCTVPFFVVQQYRPGQQLPSGSNFLLAGPKQVWSAVKSARRLKQCILYLIAWFLLQETSGTAGSITGILQNEVLHYNPLVLNAMTLLSDVAGGGGTILMFVLQRKYRFSVKAGVMYGAIMACIPALWGAIGLFTNKIGFHNVWEYWFWSLWNFQTAAWGAYGITQISEVVPAPKAFMFFAVFNTVSETTGFIGPFITSAIIDRAGGKTNAGFWFLVPLGALGCLVLYFVDNKQAKIDNARYLEREAEDLYSEEQRARRDEETFETPNSPVSSTKTA